MPTSPRSLCLLPPLARRFVPVLAALVPLSLLQAQTNYAPPFTFTTIAGTSGTSGATDGSAGSALFFNPDGMTSDSQGNLYIADSGNHVIRKFAANGVVTTVAGLAGSSGSTDGTGSAARFNTVDSLAVDAAGNLYATDTLNHTIRKITPAGVVTTLAGLAGVEGSTDGTGSAARFRNPHGIALDGAANVFVADTDNHTVRKITPAGVTSTFAGFALATGSADGIGPAARFFSPVGLATDFLNNVMVCDYGNHTIRKITPAGEVTTLAGIAMLLGSADGTGTRARFNGPWGVGADPSGNLIVTSDDFTVRRVTPTGVVTTLGGLPNTSGSTGGLGGAARFNFNGQVAVDRAGIPYFPDWSHHTIRKGAPLPNSVTTLAGTAGTQGSADGPGTTALFNYLSSIATDSGGNTYVADSANSTIRKVTYSGAVTTLAGLAGATGSADGTGAAARFNHALGVAVDSTGLVYVADTDNSIIRKITPAGAVTTFAGVALSTGSADGTGNAARFNRPDGIAVDAADNVYVADTYNHTVRMITPGGAVTTLAGLALTSGSVDGTGGAARFNFLTGLTVDPTGNVFVSDFANHTIRKVTPAGVVTTIAGFPLTSGTLDGVGSGARFNNPWGIAVTAAGTLYVNDSASFTIRQVTPAGVVTTFAGAAGMAGAANGTGPVARFYYPHGLALDSGGALLIGDNTNHLLRRADLAPPPNDNFASATTMTGLRAEALGGNFGATKEPGEPTTTTNIGGRSVWYKWTAPNTGLVTLNTAGSDFDTTLAVFTGASVGSLVKQASNDDENGSVLTSRLVFSATSGTAYYFDVDGYKLASFLPSRGVSTLTLSSAPVPGDYDANGKGDLLLTNTSTAERVIWLMNGGAISSGASLGILPIQWSFSGTGDLSADGKSDILLTNNVTTERAVWLMNGAAISSGATLGLLPAAWQFSAMGDFNADGKSDILLTNTVTGERAIWLMNGAVISAGASLGILSTAWQFDGSGDFNSDGKSDILLTNTVTNERAVWLMNGAAIASGASIGVLASTWSFNGIGDFNSDGKSDILLTNSATGERAIWLMNGGAIGAGASLGLLSTNWSFSRVADFSGDGKADIALTNVATGERAIWLMNGTAIASGTSVTVLPVSWTIRN